MGSSVFNVGIFRVAIEKYTVAMNGMAARITSVLATLVWVIDMTKKILLAPNNAAQIIAGRESAENKIGKLLPCITILSAIRLEPANRLRQNKTVQWFASTRRNKSASGVKNSTPTIVISKPSRWLFRCPSISKSLRPVFPILRIRDSHPKVVRATRFHHHKFEPSNLRLKHESQTKMSKYRACQ